MTSSNAHHQATENARLITDTITVTWEVRTEPIRCDCGHPHYGRVPTLDPPTWASGYAERLAPQWGFCEDPKCGCSGLRRTLSGIPSSPDERTAP